MRYTLKIIKKLPREYDEVIEEWASEEDLENSLINGVDNNDESATKVII